MKKLFVLAAAILMAGVASAQWSISGNIGFNSENNLGKVGNTETTLEKGHSYGIGVGTDYAFNSKWSVGARVYYLAAHSENGVSAGRSYNDIAVPVGSAEANSSFLGVTPYVRYNCHTIGNFTIGTILSAEINFGNVSYKSATGKLLNDNPYKMQELEVSLYPVVTYNFNAKWSVDMYLDFLSIYYYRNSSSHVGEVSGIETTSTVSGFGAGIYGIEFSNDAYGALNRNLMTFCIKYSL